MLSGTPLNISSNLLLEDIVINHVTFDTRRIQAQSVYVAIRGLAVDGNDYIEEAFNKGAILCIVDKPDKLKKYPGILVKNSRVALSKISAFLYDFPSKKLECIGVTGTNGKTSTTWFIGHLLSFLNRPVDIIGTLGIVKPNSSIDEGSHTTPDALLLQSTLYDSVQSNKSGCVMEVASHALHQHRCNDIDFDIGVFTNLTRDHLDYHIDMEGYFEAKKKLFVELLNNSCKKKKIALFNVDDEYGDRLSKLQGLDIKIYTYGKSSRADFKIILDDGKTEDNESFFWLIYNDTKYRIKTQFLGEYNAYNFTAAIAVAHLLGFSLEEILKIIHKVPQVPGRLELIEVEGKKVYVDYAHTPDALERALIELKKTTVKNLWVVFGCGGDRDKGKRPIMGAIAGRIADRVIVTSDNPRTEDAHEIVRDILSSGINPYVVEVDRKNAILSSLHNSEPGDVILIAGKGHENYQIIGTEKIYFSDQQIVRDYL